MIEPGSPTPVPPFVRCLGCTWNPFTDEGTRGCGWFECPRLPQNLEVHCPYCFFNYVTWLGNPACDPATCPHGAEPLKAAERARAQLLG